MKQLLQILVAAATFVAMVMGATPASANPSYGQHEPHGRAAVDFLYGPQGTYRTLGNLEYRYNYYLPAQYNNICDTSSVPNDRQALINYATGSRQTTTPDKDCRLLFDLDGDGTINSPASGSAFQEHSGVGVNGTVIGTPFNNFWFDDNWLARYMSVAYGRAHPAGLWTNAAYNRWAIIGGDTSYWSQNQDPYGTQYFDHITFNGLRAFQTGNYSTAVSLWNQWIIKSQAYYDAADQRYVYPEVRSDYYYGFFLVWTQQMITSGAFTGSNLSSLIQHAVSIRSNLLSRQVVGNDGTLLGWVTERDNPSSLINTETTSLNVLGLGAGGRYAFEAGRWPMFSGNGNYFLRPHNVLSAVKDLSIPGTPVFGPYRNFPTGPITVDFYLRTPAPSGNIGTIDIYDSASGNVLVSRVVKTSDMATQNRWTRLTLTASNYNPGNSLEFRVYWSGTSNLDIAYIQVR